MWILIAFLGVTCLGVFNYIIGTYNSSPIGGKLINSIVLGIGAAVIHVYQKVCLKDVTDMAAETTYYETMKRGKKTVFTELLDQQQSMSSSESESGRSSRVKAHVYDRSQQQSEIKHLIVKEEATDEKQFELSEVE